MPMPWSPSSRIPALKSRSSKIVAEKPCPMKLGQGFLFLNTSQNREQIMKPTNAKKRSGQFARTDERDKKSRTSEVTIVVAAACIGFVVRASFVLKGYGAFNSDETFHYHLIQ